MEDTKDNNNTHQESDAKKPTLQPTAALMGDVDTADRIRKRKQNAFLALAVFVFSLVIQNIIISVCDLACECRAKSVLQ